MEGLLGLCTATKANPRARQRLRFMVTDTFVAEQRRRSRGRFWAVYLLNLRLRSRCVYFHPS